MFHHWLLSIERAFTWFIGSPLIIFTVAWIFYTVLVFWGMKNTEAAEKVFISESDGGLGSTEDKKCIEFSWIWSIIEWSLAAVCLVVVAVVAFERSIAWYNKAYVLLIATLVFMCALGRASQSPKKSNF